MSTRSAAEVWDELVDEAGEDLIEQAANVSVEQAIEELRAAGFDVQAERAKAESFLTSLARGAAVEQRKSELESHARERALRPEKRFRTSQVVWIAAAAAATAAVGGGLLYGALHKSPTPPAPTAPPTTAPSPSESAGPEIAAATELRRRAREALDLGQASECLSLLDEAKKKDPAGDSTPATESIRANARKLLSAEPSSTLK